MQPRAGWGLSPPGGERGARPVGGRGRGASLGESREGPPGARGARGRERAGAAAGVTVRARVAAIPRGGLVRGASFAEEPRTMYRRIRAPAILSWPWGRGETGGIGAAGSGPPSGAAPPLNDTDAAVR